MINCYDGANRVSQVGGPTCGNPTLTTYAASFAYAAHGAPTQYAMGNNVWHEPSYNSRLQMSGFVDLVNNSYGDELLGAGLTWYKSSNSSLNNGNLWGATYNNGGPGYPSFLSFTDTFGYDGVNRLTTASDSGGWTRTFGYDAFGNMTPSGNPNPPTESFNGNNQITGLSYDQAGNQISVNGNTVTYDFENHVISETDGVTQAVESYVYDGDGRRVMKSGPAGTSVFVYDAMGQLAGEYGSVASAPPCLTCYLTPDHLGTPRMVTDQSGNVVARHDYLPFGEEVAANTFGRNSQWGSGNDSVKQKFTGKERDSESGLDYFGARYYGSALGRFSSPDFGGPIPNHPDPVPWTDLENPQSLNLYAYVLNNPLSSFDEDGHFSRDTYVADDDKHGGPHIDRYSNGKNVGRYQPDGTPIKHKGKTPDAVPAADKKKFDKAVEDLQRSEMQGELDRNHVLPPFPQPPIPSALAPDAVPMMNPDGLPPIFIPLPDPLPVPTPLPGPTPFPIPLPEPLPLPYPIFFSGHFPPPVGQPQ